jgi:hypothetical protein
MSKRQRVECSSRFRASETLGTPVEKSASDDVQPFDLILDFMNGFSAKIDSIVPLGGGYSPHNSRHFVPGYYRAVPLGQKTLDRREFT